MSPAETAGTGIPTPDAIARVRTMDLLRALDTLVREARAHVGSPGFVPSLEARAFPSLAAAENLLASWVAEADEILNWPP